MLVPNSLQLPDKYDSYQKRKEGVVLAYFLVKKTTLPVTILATRTPV
jgi:hypothetical protein